MRRIGLVLIVGATIALGACGGRSEDGKSSAAKGARVTTGAATAANEATAKQPLTTPQQIVYTADVHVRVDTVGGAAERATTIVDGVGGYVFSQDANLSDHADTTLVFKVPPKQFEPVLARLADLGTPLEKNLNADDVTDQVVDLEGRLKTATASATRLRALITNAVNVPDIVAIERELATRESEVESLQGRLRVVKSRVQLATITLVLTTKAAPKKADIPGFGTAFSNGWKAFTNTAKVTFAAIGASLPFLVFAGIVAAIVLAFRRRRRPAPAPTP